MEEIVTQILVLLSVKSLVRFRSVCKAWRSIFSDPAFIRAHLHHSTAKCQDDTCFTISPHTLAYRLPGELNRWPTTFSTHLRFYQWRLPPQGKRHRPAAAKFLHDKDFPYQFAQVLHFAHCDGLVFAPTNTKLFVFNPATRDAITLPTTGRGNLTPDRRTACYCNGIGFDRRTGKYKVVQAFYRDVTGHTSMGMDVFTLCSRRSRVAGDGGWWREMASDPPYPLYRCQTAVTIDVYMSWRLDANNIASSSDAPWPRGLVHLSLEDEAFGITMLPDKLENEDGFMMDVLRGGRELCLTAFTSETVLTIWTLAVAEEGVESSEWARCYLVQSSFLCHTLALPRRVHDRIILWRDCTIYSYDMETHKMTTPCDMGRMRYQGRRERVWEDLYFVNVNPYTESLVPVNNTHNLV
nr:unnamed protein product [Digitaria exilis]